VNVQFRYGWTDAAFVSCAVAGDSGGSAGRPKDESASCFGI
jgi:hypothetical protein